VKASIAQHRGDRKSNPKARKLGSKRKRPGVDGQSDQIGPPVKRKRHASSRPEVAAALYALDPSYVDDGRWLDVGRALWTWDRTDTTLGLWTAWGTKGGRRTAADCLKHWKQFGQSRRHKSVTIDDLFEWATLCGWGQPETTVGRSDRPQGGAWALAEQFLESRFVVIEGDTLVLTLRNYRGEFYRWTRGRYVAVSLGEIKNAIVRFVGGSGLNVTPMLISAVLDSIRARTEVPAEREVPCWLDGSTNELGEVEEPPVAPEDVIAAPNGLVDVRAFLEGQECLLPPTATFFCTNAVDFDFAPKGKKPNRWLAFLRELWVDDPDSICTLQEWCGYVVMAHTELQKVLMIVGPSRSGKGTLAKVLTGLVGAESVVAPKLTDFAQNFGVTPLIGKSLCIIPDGRLDRRGDSATLVERILSISGEDMVTLDKKHKDHATLTLKTRITIFTNELPTWADTAGALAARLIVLRLTKRFPSPDGIDHDEPAGQDNVSGTADPQLWAKLRKELPAILRWALRGWQRLQQRGHFLQPQSGRQLLRQVADLASPVGTFVRDECIVGPGVEVSAQSLYVRWQRHCEKTGQLPGPIQTFCRELRAVVSSLETRRKKVSGITTSMLIGVAYGGSGGAGRHLAPVSKRQEREARRNGLQPLRRFE
jgi:P4 family phage/plasmid primase-like protien